MTSKWKVPSNKRASRRGNTYGTSISHHNQGFKGCVGGTKVLESKKGFWKGTFNGRMFINEQ